MQHRDEKVPLAQVIERLESNAPEWIFLKLSDIIINPTPIQNSYNKKCSHIRDEDLVALAEAIQKNHSLQVVIIDNGWNSIEWTSVGAEALGSSIKNHSGILYLEFSLNIDQELIIGLFTAIAGSSSLLILSVNLWDIDNAFMQKLGGFLQKNQSLKHIQFNGGSTLYTPEETLESFFTGLSFGKQLTYLSLSSLRLNDEMIECLAKNLATTSTLRKLCLRGYNGASSPLKIEALLPVLKANPDLRKIALYDFKVGLVGTPTLIEILRSLRYLHKLALFGSRLSIDATQLLVDAWRNNQAPFPISTLYLKNNAITVKALYKLIDGNVYLKHLNLSRCEITDRDLFLLQALLSNPQRCHLESLSIAYNKITDRGFHIALDIITTNPLIVIDSDYLPFGIIQQNEINKTNIARHYQHQYLICAMDIARAHTFLSNEQKCSFSKLPKAALLIIMSMIFDTVIHEIDTQLSMELILKNFSTRRYLIQQGKYNPQEEKPPVSKWWSTSIVKDGIGHTLFKPQSLSAKFTRIANYEEPGELEEKEFLPYSSSVVSQDASTSSPSGCCSVM